MFDEDKKVYVLNWQPWQITYENPVDGIDSWSIVLEDGTIYFFGKAVKKRVEIQKWSHVYRDYLPISDQWWNQNYDDNVPLHTYSWHVTKILGNNYVDDGDGIPNDGDKGNWIRFDYEDNATELKYSPPRDQYTGKVQFYGDYDFGYSPPAQYNEEIWSWNRITSYVSSSFLSTITTPTHEASFITSLRDDAKSDNGTKIRKLDRIELKRRGNSNIVTAIVFDQDYHLCPGAPGALSGKLTLNGFTKFSNCGTAWEPSDPHLPPTRFIYDEVYNYSYNRWNFDSWGYYFNGGNSGYDFQYIIDNNPEVVVWPPAGTYGSSNDAQAWSIRKIIYPTGGSIEYEYEVDSYRFVQTGELSFNKPGGGIRVKTKKIDDAMGNTIFKNYYYDTNQDRTGNSTGVSTVLVNLYFASAWNHVGIGMHVKEEVHYYMVTEKITQNGDQGKTVYNFWTAKDLGHENTDPNYYLIPATSNEWKRGQLKSIEKYDNAEALIDEETYSYLWDTLLNYHEFRDNSEYTLGDPNYNFPYSIVSGWVGSNSQKVMNFSRADEALKKVVPSTRFKLAP